MSEQEAIQQSEVMQSEAQSQMPVFNGLRKRIDELADEIGNEKLRSHLHEINEDLNALWNRTYDAGGLILAIGEAVPSDYVRATDFQRVVESIQKNQNDLREEVNRNWNKLHDLVNELSRFRSNMEASIIAKVAPVLSKLVAQRLRGTIVPIRQANSEEIRNGYVLSTRLANIQEVREAAKKPQQAAQQEPLTAEERYEAAKLEYHEAAKAYVTAQTQN